MQPPSTPPRPTLPPKPSPPPKPSVWKVLQPSPPSPTQTVLETPVLETPFLETPVLEKPAKDATSDEKFAYLMQQNEYQAQQNDLKNAYLMQRIESQAQRIEYLDLQNEYQTKQNEYQAKQNEVVTWDIVAINKKFNMREVMTKYEKGV
jgi:hypothetical protein